MKCRKELNNSQAIKKRGSPRCESSLIYNAPLYVVGGDAIAQILTHDHLLLADVQVTKNENCFLIAAPGKSNPQMLALPQRPKLEKNTSIMN
jgi:hypothetical protein